MEYLKNLFFVLLALICVILDVSFFSFMAVAGATLLVSFTGSMVIAMYRKKEELIIYLLSIVLFFSIFSSLPPLIILINFLLIPYLANFIRNRFFPEPTIFTGLIYISVSLILFQLILLGYTRQLNLGMVAASGYFVLINAIAGIIIQGCYLFLRGQKSKEIKF